MYNFLIIRQKFLSGQYTVHVQLQCLSKTRSATTVRLLHFLSHLQFWDQAGVNCQNSDTFVVFFLQVINFIFFNESEMYPSLDEVRFSDSPDCCFFFFFYKIANNSCILDNGLPKFGLPISLKLRLDIDRNDMFLPHHSWHLTSNIP